MSRAQLYFLNFEARETDGGVVIYSKKGHKAGVKGLPPTCPEPEAKADGAETIADKEATAKA
jgi:hypothetical protein